jgi:hypothetical protein
VSLPEPIATATIGGKKTNRVQKVKRGRRLKADKVRALSPQEKRPAGDERIKRATAQNPDGAYVVVCISAYPSDLDEMDLLAEQLDLSRSALIRKAVKALKNNTPQAQMWKAALR